MANKTNDGDRHLFLLQALNAEIASISRQLIAEANRERDEYSAQLQEALLNERMAKRAPQEEEEVRTVSGLSSESEWGDVQMRQLPAPPATPVAGETEAIG